MASEIKRLFDIPYYQLEKYPREDCMAAKVNGNWVTYSTQKIVDQTNEASRGLIALGIEPGDKVAMISNNRPEWSIMDYALLQIGAINVPIYPTISEQDYVYIFNDAEVKLCVVSDEELLQKVLNIRPQVATLDKIFTFDEIQGAEHWTKILEAGNTGLQTQVDLLKSRVKDEDLATLIYTSGTTGVPKGVMLSHRNIASNAIASAKRLPIGHNAKALSFLPVCHIYERMLLYLYVEHGVGIYYAESLDTIGDNLREVQPDVFSAVPRLLEKVFDRIMEKGNALTGIKKSLFFWALGLAEKYKPYGANGGWYEFKLKIARAVIFKKWQEALGGNVKAVASGSAALQPRLARIFLAAGVPVMEGYGLTETSPVVSVNCEENKGVVIGSVGRPLDGVEVKIAEDGEILVKGPNVMMGYYKKPDKTREVMDAEGWFHTGDIGTMVDGEFLKITDRKKEIFKTSGGKYIAPQVMENKFKESGFIEQIMVIGENKKHPAALVVPTFAVLEAWCQEQKINFTSPEEMINDSRVKDQIWAEVEKFNQEFGHYEQVKKIELCSAEWSVESGELTPTLKLKRKQVLAKYEHLVDKIYD